MRYYYTDPIAAAFMAKHYGMLFEEYSQGLWANKVVYGTTVGGDWMILPCNFSGKCYIHPDSLKILEPQVGDICINPDGMPAVVIADNKFKRGVHDINDNSIPLKTAREFVGSSAEIIQRNGKPFFWPLEE